MKARITRPVTAMRFRKKRLATKVPGDRTFTRRSSLREYCSLSVPVSVTGASVVSSTVSGDSRVSSRSRSLRFSFLSDIAVFLPSYEMRTRGSTTA